jgi:hypothetical protein
MSTFSESILQASNADASIFSTETGSGTSENGGTNWFLWIILALIAGFLGFSLYNYLGGDIHFSSWFSKPVQVSQPTPQTQEQQQQPSPNEQALNSAIEKPKKPVEEPEVEADAANSSIQGGGKAGWCYIGEDRGFRSCAQVGVNDTCMSGEIFPTKEICVNPSLRA